MRSGLGVLLLFGGCGGGHDYHDDCSDADSDGHMDVRCGGDDCDDANAAIHPLAGDNLRVGDWKLELVDEGGYGAAVVVDVSGVVRASYMAPGTPGRVRYATGAPDNWELEDVDAEGDVGTYTAIAVGAGGSVHIVYDIVAPVVGVGHAERLGDEWIVDRIERAALAIREPKVAIDSNGTAHITFYETRSAEGGGPHDQQYLTYRDGSWVDHPAAEGIVGGGSGTIAIDGSDAVHVVFTSGDGLHHAVRTGADWSEQTLDAEGIPGGRSAWLAFDDAQLGHVAYERVAGEESEVVHGTLGSDTWTTEVVARGGVRKPTLALGPGGAPQITYVIEDGWTLERAISESGKWLVDAIGPSVGADPPSISMAVDAGAAAHLVIDPGWSDAPRLPYLTNRIVDIDGIDENCDGIDGIDADGDGHASAPTGGDDPDDGDPSIP